MLTLHSNDKYKVFINVKQKISLELEDTIQHKLVDIANFLDDNLPTET